MEISQLEYFVASVEEKSFYKASEKLYISQPAISKAISLLEKDVNSKLFERTNKGLKLTAQGEKLYHYAKNILRQVEIMKNAALESSDKYLRLSSYPSKLISTALTDFYVKNKEDLQLDYREGSVQDIIDFVDGGVSEFGIIYISPNQEDAFRHILSHKHLEFVPLKKSELCVYLGEKNKLGSPSIKIKDLSSLKYIRGVRDFFSVEHHFDYVSLNEINTAYFNDRVLTNSDHLVSQMLKKTDLCYLGIDTKVDKDRLKISIDAEEKYLTLGYIKNKVAVLSTVAEDFLAYLSNRL